MYLFRIIVWRGTLNPRDKKTKGPRFRSSKAKIKRQIIVESRTMDRKGYEVTGP